MFTIENDILTVVVQAKGAELFSIQHKQHHLDYLWSADPQYWAKKSPVLFPIVGALKDNTYYYKDQAYELPRHGFAREMLFAVIKQSNEALTFSISNDAQTAAVYPFAFQFNIRYALEGDTLAVTYTVHNKGKEEMLFSVGGHPAFKVPLTDDTVYDDYKLVFNQKETLGRWPISSGGLIEKTPTPLLDETDTLPLTKALFNKDALVFKQLASDAVSLRSDKHPHGLHFSFAGFPYLGLWAAPGADFVCIEPWCGIADSVDTDQQLVTKEGICTLAPDAVFERTWRVQFF